MDKATIYVTCKHCLGTGLEEGVTCSKCGGSAIQDIIGMADFVDTTDIMDKLNDIKEKCDEIKEVVDAL